MQFIYTILSIPLAVAIYMMIVGFVVYWKGSEDDQLEFLGLNFMTQAINIGIIILLLILVLLYFNPQM